MERRILQSSTPWRKWSYWVVSYCFAGLDCSKLSSWQIDSQTLRGLTWRAKTCDTATPFGVVLAGLLSVGRGSTNSFRRWTSSTQVKTWMILTLHYPPFGIWCPTSSIWGHDICRSFVLCTALHDLAMEFSAIADAHQCIELFHSRFKTTILSWAAQALPESDRWLHGKHRPAKMSIQLYSRDDILGSIRVQLALIEQISQGWRPVTPLSLGGRVPLSEPTFQLEKFKKKCRFHGMTFLSIFRRHPVFSFWLIPVMRQQMMWQQFRFQWRIFVII